MTNHHSTGSTFMLAQHTSSASTRRRYRQVGARSGLALIAGALAVGLIACGGGATTPAANTNTAAPPTSSAAGPQTPPGAFGTAAAVNATSLEVQNPSTGQVTVNFSSSTVFSDTVSATLADVTVGSCVTASSASTGSTRPAAGTPITATAVNISQAGANGCTAGGGRGGFGGGQGGGQGSGTSRPNRPSGTPRPSGTNGPGRGNLGGFAFGSVTAVSATGFTVHSVARGQNPATDTTVTVTSSTTYSKVESATSSALAVGDCIAAVGSTDDTGAVTAKTIGISKPGPNGCSTGFGRGGFGRGGSNG